MSTTPENPIYSGFQPVDTLALADGRIIPDAEMQCTFVDGVIDPTITPGGTELLTILTSPPDTYSQRPALAQQLYGEITEKTEANVIRRITNLRQGLGKHGLGGAIHSRVGFGTCGLSSLVKPVLPVIVEDGDIYTFADERVVVDERTYTIEADGHVVTDLPVREFQLALRIARNAGRPVPEDSLLLTTGIPDNNGNSLRVAVHHVRQAFWSPDLSHPKYGALRHEDAGYLGVPKL